jgi:hypothetical protein
MDSVYDQPVLVPLVDAPVETVVRAIPQPTIRVSAKRIFKILVLCAIILCVVSYIGEFFNSTYLQSDVLRNQQLIRIATLFNVNNEANIPNWYSTVLLFGAAGILVVIAGVKLAMHDRYRFHWAGLAIIYSLLSLDEAASLHNSLSSVMHSLTHSNSLGFAAWAVPAVAFAALLGVVYAKFLWSMPPRVRIMIIVAAVIYVTGAAGLEVSEAIFEKLNITEHMAYVAFWTIEELFEMFGTSLFIFAMLTYMRTKMDDVKLSIK